MDGIRTPMRSRQGRRLGRSRSFLVALGFVTTLIVAGCSTQTVDDTGPAPSEGENPASELSAFDQAAAAQVDNTAQANGDQFSGFGDENTLEKELNNQPAAEQPPAGDDFAAFDQQQPAAPPAQEPPPIDQPPAIDPGAAPQTAELPPPVEAPAPEVPPAPPVSEKPVTITSLKFKANDNGGTVVIEADGPMQFSQRLNPDNQQFVIDIPNSKLGKKAKRSLNTKDFAGIVGAIDAYQEKNSTTSHVVVQLRSGDQEPAVQAEGNTLLVVTTPAGPGSLAKSETEIPPPEVSAETGSAPPPSPDVQAPSDSDQVANSKLMTSDNLEQFIANNQQFYGKKISIETDEVEIRDVFKLIGEEANVNLILAEEVKGKVSVKLKNVPWDQALVLLMKTKKLGYTRSGNVIRISNLTDIRAEEKDALELQNQRRQNAVPKVRTVQVNYAKVEDLPNQIKGILTKNGAVVADTRTSSLIITDLEENIERAVKVIQSLDIPPQQVLIEGKIIEAKEDSEQNMGIQWSTRGAPYALGGSSLGPVSGTGDVTVRPDLPTGNTFQIDMRMGTFDILGDLSATLALFEKENKVKILSSPRIVAMHNEKANIQQTLEIPFRSSTISQGAVSNSVNFKEAKLELEVTPQITNDGAVMMGVKLQREFFGAIADVQTGARENNRRVTTTRVLVRNGQTAVIGGIYQNDSTQGESRVPYLGKIPVIGWLFKGQNQNESKNELLVFLTPRILGQLDSQVIPSQNNMNNNALPPVAPSGEPSGDPSIEPGLEF